MAKTSINIQPCKIASAERHNTRHKELSYLVPNPDHPNESWVSDRLKAAGSLIKYHAQLAAMVKEKTGRSMQKKASPIREAVVVIQENTTMEELRQLAKKFEETWGIRCLRIDAHFDEGYPRKIQEHGKRNLHAHMIFDYQDWDTGRSIKLANIPSVDEAGKPILDEKGKQVMVKPTTLMQDIAAECLRMDRGESSDRKHLSALAYKVEAEKQQFQQVAETRMEYETRAEEARLEVERLEADKVKVMAEISALETKKSLKRKEINQENGNKVLSSLANFVKGRENAAITAARFEEQTKVITEVENARLRITQEWEGKYNQAYKQWGIWQRKAQKAENELQELRKALNSSQSSQQQIEQLTQENSRLKHENNILYDILEGVVGWLCNIFKHITKNEAISMLQGKEYTENYHTYKLDNQFNLMENGKIVLRYGEMDDFQQGRGVHR